MTIFEDLIKEAIRRHFFTKTIIIPNSKEGYKDALRALIHPNINSPPITLTHSPPATPDGLCFGAEPLNQEP
jgi:hypothetical protein